MKIRPTINEDIRGLTLLLDHTALFPSEMLPEMISKFLSEMESEDIWLTCENDGTLLGFCYAMQEQMADGTWNMLAIAVSPAKQGSGIGTHITKELEIMLKAKGCRILIADTSGTDAFELTRHFYHKNGYAEEARIRDFWAPGDDKVTFWKAL